MRLKKIEVTVKGIYSYEAPAYAYGYETRYIYTMQGADGTVYVWKNTTAILGYDEVTDSENECYLINAKGEMMKYNRINKGDVITISATVKGEDEYNGEKQTIVNRVKVHGRTFKAKTPEEIRAEKEAKREQEKKKQLEGITEKDMVWKMPYRQYKEHYSDCETVIDSFEKRNGVSLISVIIREGRLKASGTRGKHFRNFLIYFNHEGKKHTSCYKAICEENALKQLLKEFRTATNIKVEETI